MPSEEETPLVQVNTPVDKVPVEIRKMQEKIKLMEKARFNTLNPDLNIKSKLSSLNLKKYVKDE